MTISFAPPSGGKTAPTLYLDDPKVGSKAPSYGYVGKGGGVSGTFFSPPASPPPPAPSGPQWNISASVSGPTSVKVGQSITLTIGYSVREVANDPVPAKYPVQFNSGGGGSPNFDVSFTGATDTGNGCQGSMTVTGKAVGTDYASVLPGGTDANGNSRGYASGSIGNIGLNITVTN